MQSLPTVEEWANYLYDGQYSYLSLYANNKDWGKLVSEEFEPLFDCSKDDIVATSFYKILPNGGKYPIILVPIHLN